MAAIRLTRGAAARLHRAAAVQQVAVAAARPAPTASPAAPARWKSDKRVPIYTRTGDEGTSMLFSGERRRKDDLVFEALGATDELSSAIGHARELCIEAGNPLVETLKLLQGHLQELGSHIATPRDTAGESRLKRTAFPPRYAEHLEREIDALDEHLAPLHNFILPSGGKASSYLHVCRSTARRAERRITPLLHDKAIDPSAFHFVNRLSDYLFTAARVAAKHEGKTEDIYIPPDH